MTILQLIATELADLSWWLRRMIQRFCERTGVPMLLNASDDLRPPRAGDTLHTHVSC